jgi:hypothetical protein
MENKVLTARKYLRILGRHVRNSSGDFYQFLFFSLLKRSMFENPTRLLALREGDANSTK